MALENLVGSDIFVDNLVRTNPAADDPVSQGDDHLRGIKNALLNTFPGLTGAMTLTQTQINAIPTTYAPKASPALTGTPTAPTAAAGTNTTQIATTAFVKNAVASGGGSSAAGSGWMVLAGGIIVQWGAQTCSFVPGNTATPVSFPKPMSSVFQTYATFNSSAVQTTSAVIGTASQTGTGFNIHTYSNNSFSASVAWLAIGV